MHQENKALMDINLVPQPVSDPAPTTVKIYCLCNGVVRQGKQHQCNKTSLHNNTLNLVKQTSMLNSSKVTSDLIKVQMQEQGVNRGDTVALPCGSRGSQNLKVTVGATPRGDNDPKTFTHEHIISIIGAQTLSDRAAL